MKGALLVAALLLCGCGVTKQTSRHLVHTMVIADKMNNLSVRLNVLEHEISQLVDQIKTLEHWVKKAK